MGRDTHVFFVTERQAAALQLVSLNPGVIDARWNGTLGQLAQRGLVVGNSPNGAGDESAAVEWALTKPGRLAAELVLTLNGSMKA